MTQQPQMILNTPVFDQTIRAHVFTFKTAPIYSINLTDPEVDPDISGNESVNAIMSEFLEKAARYFSKALDLAHFQKRVTHIWQKDISVSLQPSDNIQFCTYWIPDRVLFYATRYEICWKLQSIQPIIADAVLAILERGAQSVAAADPPVVKEVGDEEIPLKEVNAAKEEKKMAKQVIRHARLRIALAQLRAERLAEKYFKKYGTFDSPQEDGEGSDSDLSIDSDGEKGGLQTL